MVTGSVASSIQGEARATHDIDVVVAMTTAAVPALLAAFPGPEYYLDDQSVRDAIARRGMFNLLHADSGDKVDFWLLTDDEFDQARFRNKLLQDADGLKLNVSAPEDTILMKLRWGELSGGSEKQFRDALRVYEVQFPTLDQRHLDEWAAKLGVTGLLERLRHDARPL